jgi:nucleoside-diphosphate-sugar epimerase
MVSSLFVTGASGFIGRHFLTLLKPESFDHVYCLTRSESTARELAYQKNSHWLVGSIFDSSVYSNYLESVDAVIHLAATTGKARPDQYFNVNSIATQYLLDQCKQRGVRNFLYVSSIVVNYKDKSHYYYAQSKQEGENAVIRSGLNYTIVRPTIVLGKDSPIWKVLSALARLRVIPVLGDGRTRIQPIDVEDVADAIVSILQEEYFQKQSMDLGGPEVISIEGLLKNIHRLYAEDEPKFIHLPYKPLRWLVARSERYFSRWMPLNAGQLSVFTEEGTITSNRLCDQRQSRMKDVDTMLKALISHDRHCR